MDVVGIVGLIAIVACSIAACARANDQNRLAPALTLSVAAIVAVGLAAQLLYPTLLLLLRRDAGAIRGGELYRAFTSLFVQDGWLPGGAFNLSMMIVVGRAAEIAVGRVRWSVLYVGGGMLTELVAMRWQPIGAGNSIAYMSLAGALLTLPFFEPGSRRRRLVSAAGLGIAAALCLRQDIHGAAAGIGAVLALLLPLRQRSVGPT